MIHPLRLARMPGSAARMTESTPKKIQLEHPAYVVLSHALD
ncbi:hypothetical protein [Polymorphospora rubra]|nr:hypothetical protein [Polymorphospora rubra]